MAAVLERAARELAAGATNLEPRWWLRARYVGQGYELDVPVAPGEAVAEVVRRFEARHEGRTGFTLDRPVEFISARTTLSSTPWPVHFVRPERQGAIPMDLDDGRAMSRTLQGPCVVRLPDATMRVTPGWTARALETGGWMLETA